MVASNEHTKLVPEFIHNLFVLSSSILFFFSQPLLRVLSGMAPSICLMPFIVCISTDLCMLMRPLWCASQCRTS